MTDSADDLRWWELASCYAAFAVLYVSTAARHLLGGDAGEFATIFADGGTAHPPGYPLYSLYLRAWSWLPAATPAHGASIATALLGAGAVTCLYGAARTWGTDRIIAALAAAAFGLAPEVWLYHTSPEVFALNNLVAAAILWAAAPRGRLHGVYRCAGLGLLAGLGLSNHHTIVLLAPLGLWAVYRGVREADRAAVASLAVGAASLAVGLLPYGYLLWTADTATWHWADPQSVSDILHIFLRRDYGTFEMTADESTSIPLSQIGVLARYVVTDLYAAPAGAAVVGFGLLLYRGWHGEWAPLHSGACAIVASFLLAGPLFSTLLTIEPEGVGLRIVRRFHLVPELLVVMLAAVGFVEGHSRRVRPRVWAAVLAVLVLAAIPRLWNAKRNHQAPAVDQYVRDTFGHLPDDSIVLGRGDHHFFGLQYLQRALDRRRDVRYVDATMLAHRWYVDRIDGALESDVPYQGTSIDSDRLLEALLSTDRPVFVTGPFTEGLLDVWNPSPYGTLIRVRPPNRPPPRPSRAYRLNEELFRNFSIEVPSRVPRDTWSRHVLESYARTWSKLAEVLDRMGRGTAARRAEKRASAFRPWHDD